MKYYEKDQQEVLDEKMIIYDMIMSFLIPPEYRPKLVHAKPKSPIIKWTNKPVGTVTKDGVVQEAPPGMKPQTVKKIPLKLPETKKRKKSYPYWTY